MIKQWSNPLLLKAITNPVKSPYRIKIKAPELSFLGVAEQPDFAVIKIIIYPGDKVIELKSLKEYLFDFRQRVLSYERFVNVVYQDLQQVYKPQFLKVSVKFNPRGGISSNLLVESEPESAYRNKQSRQPVIEP